VLYFGARLRRTWEDVPETESFVTRSCYYRTAVRVHGQVKHPVGMPDQSGHSLELGVRPDVDFILGVPMSAHNFVATSAKGQIAYLRSRVFLCYYLVSKDVSKTKGSIGRSASRG
jgi:hypothetical protein